jgi:hypothetical protein
MSVANTLAYYSTAPITSVKSFIAQASSLARFCKKSWKKSCGDGFAGNLEMKTILGFLSRPLSLPLSLSRSKRSLKSKTKMLMLFGETVFIVLLRLQPFRRPFQFLQSHSGRRQTKIRTSGRIISTRKALLKKTATE